VGDIVDHGSNPVSAYFEAYSGDKALPVNAAPSTDLDNTYYFPKVGWDDLLFPFERGRQGVTFKPDFDQTNLGLLFPQNDDTEIAYMIAQLPHRYKLGSNVRPHIHYVQDEAEVPIFKMDYRWYNNGDDPTVAFTTLSTADKGNALPYTSGSILQIIQFPEIDGSHINGVSSMMDIRIYRDDNVVTGDVLAKEFDIHYLIDSIGSGKEICK
jgi:hypothetical protein